ncbi:MAG: hypothetical protein A2X86_10060 [Bdellovibrionales bacterium GWA2_49_15]|nr:MAG: hypothetical protein A2X86_10060 [Bdellovibrionales bacterium GWA2_49_15]HAZ14239.1 hypothetical protein [Bdellovibrionales bacterium]
MLATVNNDPCAISPKSLLTLFRVQILFSKVFQSHLRRRRCLATALLNRQIFISRISANWKKVA